MATEATPCTNHPDTPTRLSCSSCERPICPRCVRTSSVGQRCPDCARPPKAAQAPGKAGAYARAVAVALPAAIAGGMVAGIIGFGSIILSGAVGFGVGRLVQWAVRGRSDVPMPVLSAVTAVLGLGIGVTIVLGAPLPTQRPLLLLGYGLAAFLALRGAE